MVVKVYQYPRCSTCRKALKWLDEQGIRYSAVDIVSSPPSEAELLRARREGGLELRALFNTSGESYRAGGFKDKLKTMSEADAIAALAADGKLVKRPFVISPHAILAGFDETKWRTTLASAQA